MEIIDHKDHGDAGELLSFNANEAEIKEEVNRRTCKAGYTTRYGESPSFTKIMARGFGKSKLNVWPRDSEGNLIDD